jgi:HSP20 family protein
MSSLQEIILGSINNLQTDGDFRGAVQSIINSTVGQGKWHPLVDLIDTKDKVIIYVELPGVERTDIDLEFYTNTLSIKGKKKKQYNLRACKKEITYGVFNRQIQIPISVTKQENVQVDFKKGLLQISISKSNQENILKIEVPDSSSE